MSPAYSIVPEMPSRSTFKLIYTGPALDDGAMDVRDLAPALLSLSAIIEEANRRIGSDREVQTNFKAVTQGSLIVTLAVETTLIQNLIGLFNSDGAQAAERLLAIVGGLSAGVGGIFGIFKVIAALGKKTPDAIAPGPTPQTVYVTVQHNTFITDRATLDLALDSRIRKEAAQVVKPLQRPGVDGLAFVPNENQRERGDEITPRDLSAFAPENESEVSETQYRTVVVVESPNLGDVNGKWRLTDGDSHFWARIADKDFLNAVQANAVRFGVNDTLHCDVIRRQTRQANGSYKTEYEVPFVVSHMPGASQSPPVNGPDLDSPPPQLSLEM